MKKEKITILIPCHNEEQGIAKVMDNIPHHTLDKYGFESRVIVIDNDSTDRTAEIAESKGAHVIFEPAKEELIAELMPKILNTQLYKAVLDSNASEHGARMTAMDKASENANEILRSLKIAYNRARQAAITTELTEIIRGAAAMQG